MTQAIPLYVGYDPREAAAYHVFCQSVLEHASVPVAFIPLHKPMLSGFDGQRDGTNAFIYSRYLIPHLQDYNGWAIFCDGDMVMRADIAELWNLREQHAFGKAVCVVQHDYKTRHPRKYVGTPMESANIDYPRKNWSSVMLWNCGHYANRFLTPEAVAESSGALLHRFEWLRDEQIGALPPEWNHLVGEYEPGEAKLLHYTAGVPGFRHYRNCEGAADWFRARRNAMHLMGET